MQSMVLQKEPILYIKQLSKQYGERVILRDITMNIYPCEVVSLIGASGSGKSTLLRCINQLETQTSGKIYFERKRVGRKGFDLAQYRTRVGMVFQHFNLFNNLNVLQNCVVGPINVMHRNKEEACSDALGYLKKVGMEAYADALPKQLSGGQKQRAAVAVSMVCRKDVLIFDEPTSGLDYDSMIQVAGLFQTLSKMGKVIFVVTHDYEFLAPACTRVIHLDNGKQQEDYPLSPDNLHRLHDFFLRSERRQNLEENGK